MLTRHNLASQVESQVNDLQVKSWSIKSWVISLNSKSSSKSPKFTKSLGYSLSAPVVILAGNLGRHCPATTLANHNKYFIIIVFGVASHNSMVWFCANFIHLTDWQVKSNLKSVTSNKFKSSLESSLWIPRQVASHENKQLECRSSQPLWFKSTSLIIEH